MPVMEGKALIYKLLGGVDAVPICLGTQDIGRLIRAVKQLEPSFGGINLEDIEHPKCFDLLDKLRGDHAHPGLARRSAGDRRGDARRPHQRAPGRRQAAQPRRGSRSWARAPRASRARASSSPPASTLTTSS